ncbi:MAG: nucleotidyltransferase domain-containing protein, partial [Synergistaceae bacterium]|nr:nucleotidyltransferase domain-containing protein [Synergistaceae bacterium]
MTQAVEIIAREEIERKASEILRRYPVKKAALFGSVARGDFTNESDVDMLLDCLPDVTYIDLAGIMLDLEEMLGRSVDLITYDSLKEAKKGFRLNVEEDAYVFYER